MFFRRLLFKAMRRVVVFTARIECPRYVSNISTHQKECRECLEYIDLCVSPLFLRVFFFLFFFFFFFFFFCFVLFCFVMSSSSSSVVVVNYSFLSLCFVFLLLFVCVFEINDTPFVGHHHHRRRRRHHHTLWYW